MLGFDIRDRFLNGVGMKKQWRCHLNVHAIWDLWKQKKAIVVVLMVLIACGLTFYAMGIWQKQELAMYQNRITLFQKDRQFYNYEDVVQMRQRNEEIKEPFSYVIWGTEGTHLLENQDLGRTSRVEVYAVDGNSQLLLPSTAMLDGTITDGCLLGEKAAQELFGVTDAT